MYLTRLANEFERVMTPSSCTTTQQNMPKHMDNQFLHSIHHNRHHGRMYLRNPCRRQPHLTQVTGRTAIPELNFTDNRFQFTIPK